MNAPLRTRRIAMFTLTGALITAGLGTAACGGAPEEPPVTHLTLATGWANGPWDVVGRAIATRFGQLPNVDVSAEAMADLYKKTDALQAGDLDLALVDSETAYRAYKTGTSDDPTPHTRLRTIAVLFPTVVQIVVRKGSPITSVNQLRGKSVDVGLKGGYADQALGLILEAYGLDDTVVQVVFNGESDPAAALDQGHVDALVYWSPLHNESMRKVTESVPTTLLGLDREQIGLMQRRNHFLKSIDLPAGTYPNLDRDVLTVSEDILLLCREDLPEDLVLQLTKTLVEAVPDLRQVHPAAAGIDPAQGPTAKIPLHPGAAHYYRERELLR